MSLDGIQYDAKHCKAGLTHRILIIAEKIIADIQKARLPLSATMKSHEGMLIDSLDSKTEYGLFLILLLQETDQLDLTTFSDILNKYQKIPHNEKKTIKLELNALAAKLNSEPLKLTSEEIRLFEKYITLFFKAKNPQRNYKKSDLTGENVTYYSYEKTKIQLPLDFLPLKAALSLVHTMREDLLAIREFCYTNLFHQLKLDLESTSIPCELIIVDDEWQEDAQVCAGIALRNKAHAERGGRAIILEKSELNRLSLDQMRELPLNNIYKISTLRHWAPSTESELCVKITELTQACCSSTYCSLREISIRQCFSAGRRPGIDEASTVSRAPEADHSNNPDVKRKITDILEHKKSYEAELNELKSTYSELQTRPTSDAFIESDAVMAKLVSRLRECDEVREKIPNLLLKGYYGAVAPYPESSGVSHMRPAREQASAERTYMPQRFFKATRVAPFVTQGPFPQHQSRPKNHSSF